MTDIHTAPQYKDRLFRDIFSDKTRLLSLYNALNDSNYTNIDDLEVTTIKGIIYATMKNDLSFLIDNQMNLYEQQSTYNPNIALRGLLYFAELYQKYVAKQKTDIYSSKLIKLPTPRFIVFYNGTDKSNLPDVLKIRLSDSFINKDETKDFEWTATMLNINQGHNKSLLDKCLPLNCYSIYVDKVREYMNICSARQQAITKALDYVIKNNLLDGYFKQKKLEVLNMSLYEFDQAEYDQNRWNDGYTEGYKKGETLGVSQGISQGISQVKYSIAQSMLQDNIDINFIAKYTHLPVENIKALK